MSGRFSFTNKKMKMLRNTINNSTHKNNRTVKAVKPNILKGLTNNQILNLSSSNSNNNTKKAAKRAQFEKALNRQLEKEAAQKRSQTIKNLEKQANSLYEKTRKHRPVYAYNPLRVSNKRKKQIQTNYIQALQKYINNAN